MLSLHCPQMFLCAFSPAPITESHPIDSLGSLREYARNKLDPALRVHDRLSRLQLLNRHPAPRSQYRRPVTACLPKPDPMSQDPAPLLCHLVNALDVIGIQPHPIGIPLRDPVHCQPFLGSILTAQICVEQTVVVPLGGRAILTGS